MMYGTLELITPERAKTLLESVITNRKLKYNNLARIKRAIMNGEFVATHQGIAIDEKGHMFDGSHRCQAIVETGIPTMMFVVHNAPNVFAIDSGSCRSEKDQLYMAGVIEKGSTEWNSLCMPLINFILKRNYKDNAYRALTAVDKHKAYKKIENVVDDTIECVYKHRGIKLAAVLYSMACALNAGVPKEVIGKWHKIFSTGDFYDDDERKLNAGRSILIFKDYAEKNKIRNSNGESYVDTFIKKAMSSINYYDKGIRVTKIYGEFVYPEIEVKV